MIVADWLISKTVAVVFASKRRFSPKEALKFTVASAFNEPLLALTIAVPPSSPKSVIVTSAVPSAPVMTILGDKVSLLLFLKLKVTVCASSGVFLASFNKAVNLTSSIVLIELGNNSKVAPK